MSIDIDVGSLVTGLNISKENVSFYRVPFDVSEPNHCNALNQCYQVKEKGKGKKGGMMKGIWKSRCR